MVESSAMKKLVFMAALMCSFSTFSQTLISQCQATTSNVKVTADTSRAIDIQNVKSYGSTDYRVENSLIY